MYNRVISRVGYGSQTKDNVVSYPTVLAVNNDDLSLRPGMTDTADIVTVKRENVLLMPNAALRFTPPTGARRSTVPSVAGSVLRRGRLRKGGREAERDGRLGPRWGFEAPWDERGARGARHTCPVRAAGEAQEKQDGWKAALDHVSPSMRSRGLT